ncbi:glutathione S-transferase family protein [Marinicellulosiphila megalodicopiae]|uniref:glutathione S-transferase family protein n=1 Tax=Marinicellulosiphila megalodicopiae TaxID=2724896 RepID=UPI003BAF8C0C
MITLFQPNSLFGLPNASPFCLKLEAFMHWQSIKFTSKFAIPNQGPFQKVPFVEYKGTRIGDSSFIIDLLLKDNHIVYDQSLDLAKGHAFSRMMEEHVYWAIVYFRWMDQDVWPKLRDAFFGGIPFFVRPFIVNSAFKQAKSALKGQGMGRLSNKLILARIEQDLNALSEVLSQQDFICGDAMTHYDLSIWAILSQFMQCDLKIQLSNVTENKPELKEYLKRVNQQLQPVWPNAEQFEIFS